VPSDSDVGFLDEFENAKQWAKDKKKTWLTRYSLVIQEGSLCIPNGILTRQLSYRKEDRAMRAIYGCPKKF